MNARKKLFGEQLDFRVRLFNILAFAGVLVSLAGSIAGIFISAGPYNFVLCIVAAVFAAIMLWYASVSGKYHLCYMITIICVFLLIFPAIFFNAGGYHSGMPMLFVFAVLFTVFMLEGKKRVVVMVIEIAVYSSIYVFAYHNPEKVIQLPTEREILTDIILSFIFVSTALGVTMSLHFDLYNQRQKELEAARKQMEEYSRMKSELFAGMSHEMRTPLTVMSAYAQFAAEQIRESGANEQTLADLATISDEAQRLAEMADGTLRVLMTAAETGDTGVRKPMPVEMGELSSRLIRLLEPVALRKGIHVSLTINGIAPEIPGDTGALTQLVWNLLQNAIIHSRCTVITMHVEADNDGVKITIKDNGAGIDPGILPHVLERGVSGKKDGSGIGLAICRDIAIRHGGDIRIQSEPGAGACVTVTLRGLAGG